MGDIHRTRRTHDRRRVDRGLVAVIFIAVVLVAAACGADGDDDPTTEATLDETGATTASTSVSTSASAGNDDGDGDRDDGEDNTAETTVTTRPTTGSTSTTAGTTSASTSTQPPTSDRDGPDLVDVRAVPIQSARLLGPDTIELTVEGGVEPCFIIDRVEVVETSDQVELTVNAGSEPGAICIQIIELHTTTVDLDEALGARGVIDGATGQPLDVVS